MHYQENTLFDLDRKVKGVKLTLNVAQYPLHHVTYAPVKVDVATYNVPWLRRKCIYKKIHYLTLTLGSGVTQNAAKYPQHHLTYAPAKLDIATSHHLGKDAFTRKYII